MRFVIDHQHPPALAHFIVETLKCEALHVRDLGLRGATDAEIWRYAGDTGAVLVSKDEDFVTLCLRSPTARLLWVRLGNCRRDFLLRVFQAQWERILGRFTGGERLIELR